MIEALYIALLALLFAWANRFAGGGFGWRPTYRGRPLYYAFGALILILTLTLGWQGALIAIGFVIWRLPAWHFSFAVPTFRDFEQATLRHMAAFVMFSAAGMWWATLIYAPTAALIYHVAYRPDLFARFDRHASAEVGVGALTGGMIAVALVFA